MKLKTVGLLRWPDRPMMVMKRYDCQILESDIYPNYSGQACRVPRRWIGRQEENAATSSMRLKGP